jgi:hypothetical protein
LPALSLHFERTRGDARTLCFISFRIAITARAASGWSDEFGQLCAWTRQVLDGCGVNATRDGAADLKHHVEIIVTKWLAEHLRPQSAPPPYDSLTVLAGTLKGRLGHEVDIEWAWNRDGVRLLQGRP